METPTWAEVQLEARVRDLEADAAAATVLWGAAVRELEGQRDRARAVAVRLEQALALVEVDVALLRSGRGRWPR